MQPISDGETSKEVMRERRWRGTRGNENGKMRTTTASTTASLESTTTRPTRVGIDPAPETMVTIEISHGQSRHSMYHSSRNSEDEDGTKEETNPRSERLCLINLCPRPCRRRRRAVVFMTPRNQKKSFPLP